MSRQKLTHVSEEKKEIVKELIELIKNNKTILIASIKNLPSSQFQEIGKKLRGKAIVKVPKKNLIFRAIDESDESVKKLKEQIKSDIAILFSNIDSFELAGELLRNKSPSKAKAGQEAPKDIEVQEGPTGLVPGPAISELGALGIRIQIDKGKINIKTSKVIVKAGEKISKNVADIMSKLDIKPFSIGFVPVCSFDTQESKLYCDIKVDSEETLKDLKNAFTKALPFAIAIGYTTPETITFMIGKAGMHAKTIKKLKPVEEKTESKEEVKEETSEEKVEVEEEKVEGKVENTENKEDIQTPKVKSEGEENK